MGAAILPTWFHRAYLALPELPRAVYSMSARDGLDLGAVAARLGLSIEDVEAHLAAALIALDRARPEGG